MSQYTIVITIESQDSSYASSAFHRALNRIAEHEKVQVMSSELRQTDGFSIVSYGKLREPIESHGQDTENR